MEIKYGRSYRLSNGDKEYIELSMNVIGNSWVEHGIESMKEQVEAMHKQTEDNLIKQKEYEIEFNRYINRQQVGTEERSNNAEDNV